MKDIINYILENPLIVGLAAAGIIFYYRYCNSYPYR